MGSVVSAELAEFLDSELAPWQQTLAPIIKKRIADGGKITALEWLQRKRRITSLRRQVNASFESVDLMVVPTIIAPPPAVEDVADVDSYVSANFRCLRNTCCANILDLAALTLPAGLDNRGLPVGLQLLAPAGQEELLLAAALDFETVIGSPRQLLGSPPMLNKP